MIAANSTSPTPRLDLVPRPPHADAAAAARGGDALGGTAGKLRTETLPNGVRLVIADRPGANSVKVQVGVGAGSLQDPQGRLGTAHLVEHLAFEGSPTRSAPEQERLRIGMGNRWNAYTDTNSIVFYGIVPNKDAKTAANLLGDMFRNPALTGPRVKQELAAVKNEMIYGDGSLAGQMSHINDRLVYGDNPATNNVIGTRTTVDAITSRDMRRFHDAYFTGRNTVALVEGDARRLPLAQIRAQLGALEPGARVAHESERVDALKGRAIQVVKDPARGAVDLSLTIPLSEAQVKAADPLRARLVTSSLSTELGNTLRRYHQLTYGSWADLQPSETGSGAVLVLQASVAPGAVRDAAKDLVSVARDARDGFGAQALRRDKQALMAALRMQEPTTTGPTVSDVAENAFQAALTSDGVDLSVPKLPSARTQAAEAAKDVRRVGAVTLEQFGKVAKQLVNLDDVKVLAYGDVDAAQLKAGLADGGLDLTGAAINPVDLSMYRDMGIGVPPQR